MQFCKLKIQNYKQIKTKKIIPKLKILILPKDESSINPKSLHLSMSFLFISVTSNSWTKKIKNLPNYVSKLKRKRSNKKNNTLSNLKSYQIILISNPNTMIFVHQDNIMKKPTKDVKPENKMFKIVSKMTVTQNLMLLKTINWIKINLNQHYSNNWGLNKQQS